MAEIREGQIWKENDKRFDRFVRVVNVRESDIGIITTDADGNSLRITVNYAKRERFGKAYRLHREAEAA
jgi:hypothetical protein